MVDCWLVPEARLRVRAVVVGKAGLSELRAREEVLGLEWQVAGLVVKAQESTDLVQVGPGGFVKGLLAEGQEEWSAYLMNLGFRVRALAGLPLQRLP
jgi:hypothetical protein